MWSTLALFALAIVGVSAEVSPRDFKITHAPRSLGPHGGFQDRWIARRDEGCAVTWNGTQLTGASEKNACRWTVRYGSAGRWEDSVAATSQEGQDAAAFPEMCPQNNAHVTIDGTAVAYAEDCLFMTVYAPQNATAESKLPVFVWIHGGAYTGGSASDSGLDGSMLASEDNMIVVFLQYRLGVLGFLPPKEAPTAKDPNLAVRDVVLALKTVQANIAAVGGDPGRVTVGGQSAGASLTRTLIATPSAQGLYHGLILQSDPINFGTQSFENQAGLQDMVFKNATFANCTDFACFKGVDVAQLLSVQDVVTAAAPFNVTGVPLGESFRPQFNTTTVPIDPVNALFNNPSSLALNLSSVPLMITYTRNESGYLIDSFIPGPQVANAFIYNLTINKLLGSERAKTFLDSGVYPLVGGPDGMRQSLEITLTDAVWRCVSRAVGQKYAAAGGRVWVGEWTEGTTYSFNGDTGGYCTTSGAVCHSDDIYPTFESAPNATANATALANEVRPFWSEFIHNKNPGEKWKAFTASGSEADILNIGDEHPLSACPADFWGNKLKWDWQIYSSATNGTVPPAAGSSTPAGGNAQSAAVPRAGGAGLAPAVAVLGVVLGAVAVVF